MGGMIAICVTYRMKHLVKASVFSAPALMIQPQLERLFPLVSCLQAVVPKMPIAYLGADVMCHVPMVLEDYENDILNTPGKKKPMPARTALQLYKGIQTANEYAKDFTTPFLLMQGTEDSTCLPEGSKCE